MEGARAFVHFAGAIEQSDMSEDRTEAVVGVRKILLQGYSAAQLRDGFEMLEISRWSPEQKGLSHVALGQIWIDFEGPRAMKLRLFQPSTRRLKFEMANRADQRQRSVGESEGCVAADGAHEVLSGFF